MLVLFNTKMQPIFYLSSQSGLESSLSNFNFVELGVLNVDPQILKNVGVVLYKMLPIFLLNLS